MKNKLRYYRVQWSGLVINLLCYLGFHRLFVFNQFRPYVRIVHCRRCSRKWIMSDEHRSFLRFDNDPKFTKDMLFVYEGELNADNL